MSFVGEPVARKQTVTTDIHFVDESIITATKMDVRKEVWHNKLAPTTVSLVGALVVRSIKKKLLSISALVNKDIAVLFEPSKDLLIEMLKRNTVIGYANQSLGKLFYISDNRDAVIVQASENEDTVRAIMATVGFAIKIDTDSVSSEDCSPGK